ncbi:PREDICTED: upstream activation factor subunit [Prunus dulcis]|uniref:PREDICTED: upstream activation factor subunit n=1 Tax=Prunus dulcis TaxID=3755 RepID=A0A5E4F918_PRUDU|nr:upstream activation factor subunit spp27-like [Prunus dulcis]XP_034206469.1 upstream activation factor subunit spp27-like [Prunus dulcis]KAI5344619.1 hypothetical protein L3X38_012496 [Prunus dulcis]VVA24407.1 PREDICTED: upstream activation factor subunit [Prunus dulcis]VVA37979.1 PREDICTED: upstream activation factor subunit [Prunus dulcis]
MSSSNVFRVFRGCRALMAPARSSSSTAGAAVSASKAATAAEPKPKAKAKAKPKAAADSTKPKIPNRSLGIMKPTPISPALGSFLGASESSRAEAVKQIWAHIKLHNLQNPANKREIHCDDKLKAIFEGKEKVGFLEIGKLLSRHFVKTE